MLQSPKSQLLNSKNKQKQTNCNNEASHCFTIEPTVKLQWLTYWWLRLSTEYRIKILKVGTLNVKNIETIVAYVRELLKTCDILALQEHWLFTFQLADFEKLFVTHHAFSICGRGSFVHEKYGLQGEKTFICREQDSGHRSAVSTPYLLVQCTKFKRKF